MKIKNLKINHKRMKGNNNYILSDVFTALGVKPINISFPNKTIGNVPKYSQKQSKNLNSHTRKRILIRKS